ncbi:hypothetical protein C8R47DRAFT_1197505 [Mycena vitilis]|nr:hypothetical protein C8R47DRAFT_1197505 [Mycena vitilis]
MFSKLVPLALCALSMVKAFPHQLECVGAVQGELTQVDFSVLKAEPTFPPFKIINLGVDGSAFVFPDSDDGSILTHIGATDHGDYGMWLGYRDSETPGQRDRYIIKNVGMDAWVSIGEMGRLVVRRGVRPTVFAVESSGHNEWTLKLPADNSVWKAVYDGSSMQFGYVTLRPADGTQYEKWAFER